ncbi:DNA ligase D [Acuticoccus sp. M5D2P5]|uniref:DNA ligase D n=1 Tax=Acuticoccus kalidii TaxID=2910977 RepID=UPI001F39C318|nr:DNA ligase D [Acuticoccus kalidii]MCF3932718.1 DNA ligase D [Acuticoccus kalidii]
MASASLDRYREKRNFETTPEPQAKSGRRRKTALRFVVQKHDASRLHYDFRLEYEGVLKSWAVTRGPSLDPADKRLAVETEDHPLDYRSFEGTIPEGSYGAGTVMLWDEGTWRMADGKDAAEGLREGSLTFDLDGSRLKGRWHLQRMGAEKGRPPQWLLIKVRDAAAKDDGKAVIDRFTKSVRSGRTMAAIAKAGPPKETAERAAEPDKKPPAASRRKAARKAGPRQASHKSVALPEFVEPMLCRSRTTPPRGEGWLAEVKYDGYRAILRAAPDGVAILTRNKQNWTARFPAIAKAAKTLAERGVMLDGEIVVFDEAGRTSFNALHGAVRSDQAPDATYVAFDLLFLDGADWRGQPIEARKAALAPLVADLSAIRFGDHIAGGKQEALFERAKSHGLEGIVAKRAGSRYRSGRHDDWVKVRAVHSHDFVVGAYTLSDDGSLGALVVGAYAGGDLVPAGRVGTGYSRAEAAALLAELEARGVRRSPFSASLKGRGHHFVKPELVVGVDYLTITTDGAMRHPVYRRRVEADPKTVHLPSDHPAAAIDRAPAPPPDSPGTARRAAGRPARGTPAGRRGARKENAMADSVLGVSLSHPERVLFPEQNVTKADLARHYEVHMDLIMPHVEGRPLTLLRCPQGRARQCFYQRHPEGLPERMARDIGEEDGAAIVVSEPADIIELVQRGVLEIHLRGAKADRPDRPDRLIFDLDPGDDVPFEAVKDAAVKLRDHLADLDLVSFVKTTGGKGLHVMLPIERRTSWEEAKAWTRAIATHFADTEPDRFLVNMKKAKRRGKIFIDYLRNDVKSSAVAPYSSRAREGAPFSVPVTWEALAGLEVPNGVHVGERIATDAWADVATVRQRLTAKHLTAIDS